MDSSRTRGSLDGSLGKMSALKRLSSLTSCWTEYPGVGSGVTIPENVQKMCSYWYLRRYGLLVNKVVVLSWWLDLILEVFSNLKGSVILWFYICIVRSILETLSILLSRSKDKISFFLVPLFCSVIVINQEWWGVLVRGAPLTQCVLDEHKREHLVDRAHRQCNCIL